MKDTQGIVSSEAACTSCRDGYVLDSRDSVWKHQSHTTFVEGQPASEAGPCNACHVPHDSAGIRLWARKTAPGNPASQVGLPCHREAPDCKIKGIGKYSHPNDMAMVSEKDGKPLRVPPLEKPPRFGAGGNPLPAGSMQCISCCNANQRDHRVRRPGPGKNAEGNADTGLLRTTSDRAICTDCHGQTAIWRFAYF